MGGRLIEAGEGGRRKRGEMGETLLGAGGGSDGGGGSARRELRYRALQPMDAPAASATASRVYDRYMSEDGRQMF